MGNKIFQCMFDLTLDMYVIWLTIHRHFQNMVKKCIFVLPGKKRKMAVFNFIVDHTQSVEPQLKSLSNRSAVNMSQVQKHFTVSTIDIKQAICKWTDFINKGFPPKKYIYISHGIFFQNHYCRMGDMVV